MGDVPVGFPFLLTLQIGLSHLSFSPSFSPLLPPPLFFFNNVMNKTDLIPLRFLNISLPLSPYSCVSQHSEFWASLFFCFINFPIYSLRQLDHYIDIFQASPDTMEPDRVNLALNYLPAHLRLKPPDLGGGVPTYIYVKVVLYRIF